MSFGPRLGHTPMLLTRMATLVAVGLASGLLLSAIPNVELVTAICFIAGFLLGPSTGTLTAALTELLFAGFNPMGGSFGILLVAQVSGMTLAGLAGALVSPLIAEHEHGSRYVSIVIGIGVLVTVIYDFLTNLAIAMMAGFSFSALLVTLVAGIPFAVIHVVSNGLVFAFIVTPLLPRLEKAWKVS
jgi:hypothetical protein